MSTLRSAGRSAAAHTPDRSAAAHDNARASLCLFTFTDGRRCRTPRSGSHLHFCFYHARKESQAKVAEKLGKDLSFFFSGEYLSACDLSTALGRLLAAVVRGDIKPKTATTIAYLAQTLVQTLHLAQREYANAFGTDAWRKSVRNSVGENFDYRNPPKPDELAPEPEVASDSPSDSASDSASAPAPGPLPTHLPDLPACQPSAPATSKPQPATPPPIPRSSSNAHYHHSSS
jgi:hypothetical protein